MPGRTLFAGVFFFFATAALPPRAAAQLESPTIQSTDKVDIVDVHLTPRGPWPTAITHAHTPFILYISNRSGVLADTYSFILKRPGNGGTNISTAANTAMLSLLDLHSDNTKHHDQQIVKPSPGEYELRFQSHPDWIVSFTITAK